MTVRKTTKPAGSTVARTREATAHPAAKTPAAARTAGQRCYWLLKTEPGTFSYEDLVACPQGTTGWSGVRNFQARNFMRDGMKIGDGVLIYHSSTLEPAVVGIAEVVREGYPDPTALDRNDPYFDPRSRSEAPTWIQVDVKALKALKRPVTLAAMRTNTALAEMALLRKGNRLSVQPVREAEWKEIRRLGDR
jgi:predicted RNA-binding protein with PUA-like domain